MEIAKRLTTILAEIETEAVNSGRAPGSVKLVAVSKTHPAEAVLEAIDAGVAIFGENKVQEGLAKIAEIGHERAEWHLIGHLQKNKARKAVQDFDVIQSIDSLKLAKRITRIASEEGRADLRVLAQVDLAGESSKSGIDEKSLPEVAEYLAASDSVRFEGLMTIPPYFENAEQVRPYFRRLREIRDGLRATGVFPADGGELSMGMSHDFKIAIQEGATLVRIGTALFGARNYGNG